MESVGIGNTRFRSRVYKLQAPVEPLVFRLFSVYVNVLVDL